MSLPAVDFILQQLLEFDPAFDVGSGIATTGLMVQPLAIILQPVIDELSAVQATQSILTILEAADPDTFPEDVVDALASNQFVERKAGDIGSTVERIRFFAPQNYSAPKGALIWRGPAGQRYTNSQAVSLSKAGMSLNQEGSLFYVDIPIIAVEEGAAFNVDAGTIVDMEAQPVGVASVTNLFRVEAGRNRETNTELIRRIKVAVTVRALVTGRGIVVSLSENFTTVVEAQPIGFGQPEMMRDIVYNVHIGGDVDIFVRTPTLVAGKKDVFGLKVDPTRRVARFATAVALDPGVAYDLGRASIDRTDRAPTVKTVDGAVTFVEGADYVLDDINGTIKRPVGGGGSIFHIDEAVDGTTLTAKRLRHTTDATFFQNVRAGMILTIKSPAAIAGAYTIKQQIAADTIEVYGTFAQVGAGNINFQVDDFLSISFDYNPVTVDVIGTARSAGRAPFTVSEVPLMRMVSVEALDPLTQEPTGVFLSQVGGFGAGGFGLGAFGVGSGPDYRFSVSKATLRFSVREDNFIEFDQALIGTSVRISYMHDPALAPLQAYVDDPQNQTEAASLLVRRFLPIYVNAPKALSYDVRTADQATALSSGDMAKKVIAFITDVDEGQALELSDLVDLLYDNGAVEVDLDGLRQIVGELHHQDGTIEFLSTDAKGRLIVPSAVIPDPTTRPLSSRIARFIGNDITMTRNLV